MAHNLRALISSQDALIAIADKWILAEVEGLSQSFGLLKLSDALLDDINELVANVGTDPFPEFDYLSASLHEVLLAEAHHSPLVYLETDYFGGVGFQSAMIYQDHQVLQLPLKTSDIWHQKDYIYEQVPEGDRAINCVLKRIGVTCRSGQDEFDSLMLAKYRSVD